MALHAHSLFYFPYAQLQVTHARLIRAAALYFDKLYILDPLSAAGFEVWQGTDQDLARDMDLLEKENILVRVPPEGVLKEHESAIAAAIRADMEDKEFLALCAATPRTHWSLALAKVPREIREDPQYQPLDDSMRRLMSTRLALPGGPVEPEGAPYDEAGFYENRALKEYRIATYPVALGESIMVNHALFGGILYSDSTPLTDDPFHDAVLRQKMKRAAEIPEIRQALEEKDRQHRLSGSILAATALQDAELNLPSISPDVPLSEVMEYRRKHADELQRARQELGFLAREIREKPWEEGFEDEIDHKVIPQINKVLSDASKARDSWLSQRKLAVVGSGSAAVTLAATTIKLVLSPTPFLPILIGLEAGGVLLSGLKIWLEAQNARKGAKNGLHYLLA